MIYTVGRLVVQIGFAREGFWSDTSRRGGVEYTHLLDVAIAKHPVGLSGLRLLVGPVALTFGIARPT